MSRERSESVGAPSDAHRASRAGVVVSDLHLFARRSEGDEWIEEIHTAAEEAELLVLNGDTFDFQWSRYATHEETAVAARAWIERLVSDRPDCEFHIILGNHDCVPEYCGVLEQLAMEHAHVFWHEIWFRAGSHLFLHGDMAHRRMDPAALERYRAAWQRKRRYRSYRHRLYTAVGRARVDRAFQRVYFTRRAVVRRLHHYLETLGRGVLEGISEVWFGHTHVAFRDYEYRGLLWHNTGSAVQGARFDMRRFVVES